MGIPCKTLPGSGDLANLGGMSRTNAQYGFPLQCGVPTAEQPIANKLQWS